MKPIIHVENLGKKYTIASSSGRYVALRDVLTGVFRNPILFFRRKAREAVQGGGGKEEFWALQNLNFDIQRGEVIGVIGKNGAGKSTLLKILSRITPPTEGEIRINGRVGSLLEVGTGFHPELSGRENIFLNGAILGMTKKELSKKFDQIVEFSGIQKFIDTPVKHYSSGMYVRLAFSVAAHMEPDILVIDEVLAVGDVEFQKKCLGKMGEITQGEGRTILFVSHNMNAIEQLCNKCILLKNGEMVKFGPTEEVVKEYLSVYNDQDQPTAWENLDNQYDNDYFKPTRFFLSDHEDKIVTHDLKNNEDIFINMEIDLKKSDQALSLGYRIFNEDNILLYWSFMTDCEESEWPKLTKGKNLLRTKIPSRFLNEGSYRIEMVGWLQSIQWLLDHNRSVPTIYLTVSGGLSESPYWIEKRSGVNAPAISWEKLSA